ncbi:type I-C CRISPR-associated protein Cas7/Csd2 [Cloacibacillus sp. An23]|uniref:type I-C CRISPR-associated protein Cas7/Csd2 n=1 Tax=Cloacibacillus sp. An23 TaxID=1965591 RepID=UPI000B3A144F|nr:type I-C CRISPR-associated protein Cas7/Csd2 [Cloacibacillus sp. An23]OUO94104.1 type I-C CRISPR-associated protein Cas7/Csd2 [Cloacibacillus sp. An23]
MTELKNKYDFLFFFDVKDGNPNGDPDAGNLPRIDAETGDGLVTDVCIKRKIRNYFQITAQDKPGFDIFVKEKAVLNNMIAAMYDEQNGGKTPDTPAETQEFEDKTQAGMCRKYFDIRAFGAVMSTGNKEEADTGEAEQAEESGKKKKAKTKIVKKAGQVRGPVQLTFSRSVEPIIAQEHAITRMAVTNEKDAEKERTIGRKYTVPYGLYRGCGFVSPYFAKKTGFSEEDLKELWKAMENMFEFDHSAARGMMSLRKLIVFRHDSALGDRPAYELFDRVQCRRVTEGPARGYEDYSITIDGKEAEGIFVELPAK